MCWGQRQAPNLARTCLLRLQAGSAAFYESDALRFVLPGAAAKAAAAEVAAVAEPLEDDG
jgi:hypothetical protein